MDPNGRGTPIPKPVPLYSYGSIHTPSTRCGTRRPISLNDPGQEDIRLLLPHWPRELPQHALILPLRLPVVLLTNAGQIDNARMCLILPGGIQLVLRQQQETVQS